MRRRVCALALFTILSLAVSSRPLEACSCVSGGPACQAFWTTDAVFDATVVGITPVTTDAPRGEIMFTSKVVKLDVRQSWKGTAAGPLEITTPPEGGGCGYPFKVGGRYLIFAHRAGSDERLQASICSLTQEFNGQGAAKEFLDSLAAPPTGGRIFGTVRTVMKAFDFERPRTESPTETTVRLAGAREEKQLTSSNGRYEFTNLPNGPYRVDVVVPDGYSTYAATRTVEIADRRGCAEETFVFHPAGRIMGRLVGPDGRGLSRVQVEVTSPDLRPTPDYGLMVESASTDSDGYFALTNLSPGRYIAGVNLRDLPSKFNPYARTVYPGDTPEPQILTLAVGQTADLGTWRMPPPLDVVRLPGIVTWSDGTPAGKMYVGVWDRTGNPVERARGAGGATSGDNGRFEVEVRRGRVYTFMVRDSKGKILRSTAPRVEIGSGAPEPVHVVIQIEQ